MKKIKTQRPVLVGDVYAVPLGTANHGYGYVRTYSGEDIAILKITSGKRLLAVENLVGIESEADVFALRTNIEKGRWPLIGNIPFPSETESWAPPRKQVSTIRPDVKMVAHRGNLVRADKFGAYDDLPTLYRFSDENIVEFINSKKEHFKHEDS